MVYEFSCWLLPVLVAITMHEAAHGYIAWKLGDSTAMRAGRVTANPLKHIDPVGTLLLPGLLLLLRAPFLFGFAKPVPVDFSKLRNPRRDMVWVALAGPMSNVLLAIVSAVLIGMVSFVPGALGAWIVINLGNSIFINLLLAIFNLIPLPPLDGGRIAVGLLPNRWARPLARLEQYGVFILLAMLFVVPMVMEQVGISFNPFHWLVLAPVLELRGWLTVVTGIL